MDTSAITTDHSETVLPTETTGCGVTGGVCGMGACGGTDGVEGGTNTVQHGGGLSDFASKNSMTIFWVAAISVIILIIMLILLIMGRLHFGKAATGSSFVPTSIIGGNKSKFTGYNWYMTDGDAGYGSTVDIPSSGISTGFGVSNFDSKRKSNFGPLPGVRQKSSQFATGEEQRRVAEELIRKSKMEAERKESLARREGMTTEEETRLAQAYAQARAFDEVGARQARVLGACGNAWDPMATEEAKVLGAVGVFKPNTPGMSSFSKAINDNIPLTDTQLEAIMQGGEPYTVSPVGMQDRDFLSAQQRQEQIMVPPRRFV